MSETTWKLRTDESTGAPIHDTKDPLGCCERCRKAEIGRRSTRRPTLRYSQTASTGTVVVLRGETLVATLRKDSLFGWGAEVAPEFAEIPAFAHVQMIDGLDDRREAIDRVAEAYVLAWKNGIVR